MKDALGQECLYVATKALELDLVSPAANGLFRSGISVGGKREPSPYNQTMVPDVKKYNMKLTVYSNGS